MFKIFLITIGFLPFSYGIGNFEIGVVTLNPYIAGIVLVFLYGLFGLVMGYSRSLVGGHDVFLIMLAFTFLASTVLADNVLEAGFLAFHALFVPIITYFSVRAIIVNDGRYISVVQVFVISVTAFALYYIYHFLLVESRVKVLGLPPIGVATLTSAALIFAFGMRNRVFVKPMLAVLAVALLLTLSRAYLLSMLLIPVLWRLLKKRKSIPVFLVFMVSGLLLTVVVAYNAEHFRPVHYDKSLEFTADRLTDINFLLGTIYGRAVSYKEGIDAFLSAPLFGHGLFKGEYMVTQHNFHIEWLQYGGMIGYLLYFMVLYIHVKRMEKVAAMDQWIGLGLLAMFVILANSLTNGIMHGIMPLVLFMVMGLNEARLYILKNNAVVMQTDSERPRDGCGSKSKITILRRGSKTPR